MNNFAAVAYRIIFDMVYKFDIFPKQLQSGLLYVHIAFQNSSYLFNNGKLV